MFSVRSNCTYGVRVDTRINSDIEMVFVVSRSVKVISYYRPLSREDYSPPTPYARTGSLPKQTNPRKFAVTAVQDAIEIVASVPTFTSNIDRTHVHSREQR